MTDTTGGTTGETMAVSHLTAPRVKRIAAKHFAKCVEYAECLKLEASI